MLTPAWGAGVLRPWALGSGALEPWALGQGVPRPWVLGPRVVLPAVLAGAAVATLLGRPGRDRLERVAPQARPERSLTSSSARGWQNPLLDGARGSGRTGVRQRLEQLLLGFPTGSPRAALLAGVAGVPALLLRGPVAGVLAVLAVHVALRARATRAARRGRRDERAGAVEACAALSSELRAGRTPADALDVAASAAVGAVAVGMREGAAAARLGADVPAALVRVAGASAAPELLHGLAACWRVCSATGSGLATAVDRLADGLARAEAQRRHVDAELAGPRATAVLLATLPLAGIALAAGLGARPVHVLLDTSVGVGCLTLGLALEAVGLWWTGRIVASAGGQE